jgi:hypothetical protein
MDFDVFKIDFGSEQNIKANDPFKINNTSPLLDRLNFLNDYADNHEQNLVEFAESDYVYKKNMSVHVGGFPVQPYPTNKNLTYPQ